MMLENFLPGLFIASTLSGFVTEGIKKLFNENGFSYCANRLSAVISAVVSILLGSGYVIFTGTAVTLQVAVTIIAFILMTWLCAMVGYDKVMQTIDQFQTYGKGE